MKLDRIFAREVIKEANGDGSREAKFDFMKKVEAARKDLSKPCIMDTFDECVKTHGRVSVAICVAVTLYLRRERIDNFGLPWALEVLKLWTNHTPMGYSRAYIEDYQLHPTKICSYAASFLRITTEEGTAE